MKALLPWVRKNIFLVILLAGFACLIWWLVPVRPVITLSSSQPIRFLSVSPDGKYVAAACVQNTRVKHPTLGEMENEQKTGPIRIYEIVTGKELWQAGNAQELAIAAVFSPDGKHLATVTQSLQNRSDGCDLKCWELATGQEKFSDKCIYISVHDLPFRIPGCGFSPDGNYLALVTPGKSVKVIRTSSSQLIANIPAAERFCFAPDSKSLATTNYFYQPEKKKDQKYPTQLWSTETGQLVREFTGHDTPVFLFTFSPDGAMLATATAGSQGGPPHIVKIWNVQQGDLIHDLQTEAASALREMSFTRDGQHLYLREMLFNRLVATWKLRSSPAKRMTETGWDTVFSADGKRLAHSNNDHVMGRSWEVLGGKPPPTENERRIYAKVMDLATENYIQEFDTGLSGVSPSVMFFVSDSKLLAVSALYGPHEGFVHTLRKYSQLKWGKQWDFGRNLFLFDTATGKCTSVLEGYREFHQTQDGRYIISENMNPQDGIAIFEKPFNKPFLLIGSLWCMLPIAVAVWYAVRYRMRRKPVQIPGNATNVA